MTQAAARDRSATARPQRTGLRPGRFVLLLGLCAWQCAAAGPAVSPDLVDGRLAPCPPSPNCVSSQAADSTHRVAPLRYAGETGRALDRLAGVVAGLPRTRVTRRTGTSLHAECRSWLLRFVDDVDVVADEAAQLLHVRSASRTGYWDLGVNRRRVERLRAEFEQRPAE